MSKFTVSGGGYSVSGWINEDVSENVSQDVEREKWGRERVSKYAVHVSVTGHRAWNFFPGLIMARDAKKLLLNPDEFNEELHQALATHINNYLESIAKW